MNAKGSRSQGYKKFLCFIGTSLFTVSALAHDVPIHPSEPNLEYGSKVFSQSCVLCHGKAGEGDGRMAKVLKSPAPADLTASRLPDDYLREIIVKGSEAVGRSKHMPPWGDELQDVEIDSVMMYVKSIRD